MSEIPSKNVMIDAETLATTADAVILSIGAVKFDLAKGRVHNDDGFYCSISVESNLDLKRRISEDTLIWWMKQPAEAQVVFHEPKETLAQALLEFSDWLATDDYVVWSNGADFDIPMLQHAYTQLQMETPWKFWNSRCFRTLKNLPGAKNISVPPSGIKHNALADAYNQAQMAVAIYQKILMPHKVKA